MFYPFWLCPYFQPIDIYKLYVSCASFLYALSFDLHCSSEQILNIQNKEKLWLEFCVERKIFFSGILRWHKCIQMCNYVFKLSYNILETNFIRNEQQSRNFWSVPNVKKIWKSTREKKLKTFMYKKKSLLR